MPSDLFPWWSEIEAGSFDDLSAEPGPEAIAHAMVSIPESLSLFSSDKTAPLGMCLLALNTFLAAGTFTSTLFLTDGNERLQNARAENIRRFLGEVRWLWRYLQAKNFLDPEWLDEIACLRECHEFEAGGEFYPSACNAVFDLASREYHEATDIVWATAPTSAAVGSFDARQWAMSLPALNQHYTDRTEQRGREDKAIGSKVFAAIRQEISLAKREPSTFLDPSAVAEGPSQPVGPEMLSCADLARQFSVDAEALRGRLKRWMPTHQNEWVEVSDRAPREPRYLYRVNAVLPIIQELKASGETSGERPAK